MRLQVHAHRDRKVDAAPEPVKSRAVSTTTQTAPRDVAGAGSDGLLRRERAAFPAVTRIRAAHPAAVIRRYCGAPGCSDPDCHDEQNHGFDRVRPLRGRTVYFGEIGPGDIGTGTGTNQKTRNYVNNAPYPEQVSIEYNSDGTSGTGGYSEFINQPLAPGQRADAGHIFGNQYGGYGNQTGSVFPQHPQTNRGNSYNGQPTRGQWRAHEDEVRKRAQSGQTVRNTVTIRDDARLPYYCQSCNKPLDGASTCLRCGQTH